MWRPLLLVALLVATTGRGVAAVVEVDGARFPARIELPGADLSLRGAGTLRYGLLWRVYTAALYAPPHEAPADLPPAGARRLEIVYYVDISRREIADFAERHLGEHLDPGAWRDLAPRVRAWHAAFRDVRAGDRYVMQYERGTLSLWLNGERLAGVADPQLAAAYFGLWLGDAPIDPGLRRALLGAGLAPDG